MSNIGSARATSYAGMIISRCCVGIGSSVALAFGGATVSAEKHKLFVCTEADFVNSDL
jgi:hypothetical protein